MLRKEPFKGAKKGTVFAVRIGADRWGFVRFRTPYQFGVLPCCSRSAGMPRIEWTDDIEKWFAGEWPGAERYETDDYVMVGEQAFRDADRSRMPDMYQRPDHPWQPWVVFRAGEVVHVNGPADVVGMPESRNMSPTEIRQFLQNKHEAGELVEVEVAPPESAG
jgi:hypothetical protein